MKIQEIVYMGRSVLKRKKTVNIFEREKVIQVDNISRLSKEAEQIRKQKGYYISPYEWNEMMKMAGKISSILSGPAATTMTYEKSKIILEIVMSSIQKITE